MSGRPCEACRHPERGEIERAILDNVPFRSMAARYGMSDVSLIRHRNAHMAEQIAEAATRRLGDAERLGDGDGRDNDVRQGHGLDGGEGSISPAPNRRQVAADTLDIVGQLQAVNGATLRVLTDARAAGDGRLVLLAVDRVQKQLELQARLLGQINDQMQVNIWLSPEWKAIETVIMDTLAVYPDARYAVAERLTTLRPVS